jgi:hypothetical protein
MRLVTSLCCAAALTLAVASGARADEYDKLTHLTFSGPVQLPGVTLGAGTYTFKLAPTNDRHIVQIFKKDNNQLIATLMTMPNRLLTPPDDPYVMFAERPAGSPAAMKAWFYPGNSSGWEFIYPKQQAMAIAKANREPVLSTDSDVKDPNTFDTARVNRIDETGATVADNADRDRPAPAASASTSIAPRDEGQSARAVGTAGQAAQDPAPRRTELPTTGSPFALIGLLSGLSLAGASLLRQFRG